MRILLRLSVLALAAVGVKALYDWLAPRRDDLRRAGTELVTRTTSAAREVGDQATEAARRVAQVASDGAGEVADTAKQKVHEVKAATGDARGEVVEPGPAVEAHAGT